jgi:hypothetical protein
MENDGRFGDVTHWYSACLSSSRSWNESPAPAPKKKKEEERKKQMRKNCPKQIKSVLRGTYWSTLR